MKVIINKLRENAKLPYKKHVNDAGYDLAWAPDENDKLIEVLHQDNKTYNNCLVIRPNESKRFGTGIRVSFPPGNVMDIKERSGIASKKNLLVGACVVDSDYTGEIFVDLHNVSNKPQVIEIGERIAQFLIYKIENCIFEEATSSEYEEEIETSIRGDKGFGSTGVI